MSEPAAGGPAADRERGEVISGIACSVLSINQISRRQRITPIYLLVG